MITRDQWNAMTPQQQFDYVRMLEDTVDTAQLDGADDDTQPVEVDPRPLWEQTRDMSVYEALLRRGMTL